MYWGITPALDFQNEITAQNREELNILLIGSLDARHILKTISQRYMHESIKINFYVAEFCMELVARQLLLLNLAFERSSEMGVLKKTKLFMEIYGNTIMRPSAAKYVSSKGLQLVRVVTDLDYCKEAMKIVDISGLKYRERDYLERIFQYWYSNDPCAIVEYWDKRMRKLLGFRYDSRLGVFDWDLHMNLHSAGATQICPQEYKHWRNTGVAFNWPESEVSKPNRTIIGGISPTGETFIHIGYQGDIESGPFFAYGIECKDEEKLKKVNHSNKHRATDITEYNLIEMFHEIENQSEYTPIELRDLNLGCAMIKLTEDPVIGIGGEKVEASKSTCFEIDDVTINFLPFSNLEHLMCNKTTYRNFFDVVYISHLIFHKVEPDFLNLNCKEKCLLIIENPIYWPTLKKERRQEIVKEMMDFINLLNNCTEIPFDNAKDCYAKFIVNS